MYRRDDYAKSGLPMLPVTHGPELTRFHIWLYTIALFATTMLPYAVHMSGLIYLVSAIILGCIFLGYAWRIYRHYDDILARKTFTFSIIYLSLLFAALLLDHYLDHYIKL
jgi:protoheme IX farnesyltransferase